MFDDLLGKKDKSIKATSTEARIVNEVESTDGAEESGVLPVDFASLDQSCLVDGDNNSPLIPAPAIPHGSGIKYIRLVAPKQKMFRFGKRNVGYRYFYAK